MGGRVKVDTVEVKGRSYDMFYEDGHFIVDVGGEAGEVACKSVDLLRSHIAALTRRQATRVSVPFVSVRGGLFRRGVAVGRHAGTDNVLVKWEGEKGTAQESNWDLRESIRPLTDAEEAE